MRYSQQTFLWVLLKGAMMKLFAMFLVVAMTGGVSAETDAKKIERLEKENLELRQEVSRLRQALAILQRRIERENEKDVAKKTPDVSKPVQPVKHFAGLDAIKKAIPPELLGTENAAKGSPFDPKKLNEWLAANIEGKGYSSDRFQFDGRIDVVKAEWVRSGPGAFYVKEDVGLFVHTFQYQPRLVQWYIFPNDQKNAIAKIEANTIVVASGVIRKVWVDEEDRNFYALKIAVDRATLKPSK